LSHHPTRAEIDLEALAFNLNQVRSLVGREKKILAVVKANAYGHGAVAIVRELADLGIDCFGVAFVQEGMQLRKAAIEKPILILGGIFPFQISEVFSFDLTPVIANLELAHSLDAEARRQGKRLAVHIKIDTGMNRLGIPCEHVDEFFDAFRRFDYLEIEGILSHFSSADLNDRESTEFTRKQAERFREALKEIESLGLVPPLIHMANSSAIMEGVIPELNMVRAGLMLYGAYPSKHLRSVVPLKPVMTLETRVMHIKALPPGVPISYSRTFHTQRESRIAVLAIGYGDGYRHCLSNRGKVLIQGREVPVVGSICMDLTMVDTTEITEARAGDEVVLFGRQEGKSIAVEDVAQWAGTIPYEVLCGIGPRVPRIYKK
jgi:alanine racemase